jgi:Effector-associated domain 1
VNEVVMPPATMDKTQTLSERVRDALLDCFSPDDLRMLVSDRLDVKLAWVAPDRSFAVIVFELVEWAQQKGRLCELLRAAADRVPGKPILATLCAECLVTGGGTSPSATRENLREAVVRFAERFRHRQRSVRLLEAYKSLHDVLHELEEYQDTINRAVAAARGGPPGPDPEGVVDQLRDWAASAHDWAEKTKRPHRHRPWVEALERSVDVVAGALTGTDPQSEVVTRAVESLANLPAERQSGLNDLLIETLADFETDDLQQPLTGVLDAVRAASGGMAFEERLTSFQAAVQAVVERSRDHDLCQKVSDVLIQACRLTVVTADKVTDWADVCVWLNQLAGYRPADQRAKRTAESAARFNAAQTAAEATAAFRRLEERFADLFYFTDKSLLADTQRLVSTADALSAHLDGMLK